MIAEGYNRKSPYISGVVELEGVYGLMPVSKAWIPTDRKTGKPAWPGRPNSSIGAKMTICDVEQKAGSVGCKTPSYMSKF